MDECFFGLTIDLYLKRRTSMHLLFTSSKSISPLSTLNSKSLTDLAISSIPINILQPALKDSKANLFGSQKFFKPLTSEPSATINPLYDSSFLRKETALLESDIGKPNESIDLTITLPIIIKGTLAFIASRNGKRFTAFNDFILSSKE